MMRLKCVCWVCEVVCYVVKCEWWHQKKMLVCVWVCDVLTSGVNEGWDD